MADLHPDVPTSSVRPRLWRSRRNKVIAGVLGGFAERFDLDPTLVRVVYVVFGVLSAAFPATLIYIILWLITSVYDAPETDRRRT